MLQVLRSGLAMPLHQYLNLDPMQWRQQPQDTMYSMAWGLLYFLMSDAEHKVLLTRMLKHIAANKCQAFSTLDFLQDHYPGGVQQLENKWQQWLSKAPVNHYY